MRSAAEIGYRFSPLQVGFITDCIEPLSVTSDAEWALQTIVENPELDVVPIEGDTGVLGFVEKRVLEELSGSAIKHFFQKGLESYVFPAHRWIDATDYVDRVVAKDLEQADRSDPGWYIVQYRRSYLGILNLRTMLFHLNELRAQDLKRAGEMQRYLLAKPVPNDPRFGLVFYNRMAHEVGGDFYRAICLGPDRRLVACFDVAGKNISGALAASSLGAFFAGLGLFSYEGDARKTAGLLNSLVRDVNPDDVFVAAVLFFLDFAAGTIEIFNCGFSPVYIFSPQEDRKVNCRITKPNIPPLGIEDNLDAHTPLTVPIAKGLRLVAFSDGLIDMTDQTGERYGEERSVEFLRALYKEKQSKLTGLIDAEVNNWIGESHLADDITLVDIRFT